MLAWLSTSLVLLRLARRLERQLPDTQRGIEAEGRVQPDLTPS